MSLSMYVYMSSLFMYVLMSSLFMYLFLCISFYVSFYVSPFMYLFLCISFHVFLFMYFFLCISFYASLFMYLFLCITFYVCTQGLTCSEKSAAFSNECAPTVYFRHLLSHTLFIHRSLLTCVHLFMCTPTFSTYPAPQLHRQAHLSSHLEDS